MEGKGLGKMKKFISLLLVLLITLNVVFPVISLGKEEKQETVQNKTNANLEELNNNYNEDENLVKSSNKFDNKDDEEDEENYTEEYKKWLELPKEEREKYGAIPRKYKVPFSVLYEDEESEQKTSTNNLRRNVLLKSEQEELPESFDLRNKIEVPVRNQGWYGLCWDFASMKCLETYLALNGYGNYDFSELHLDYLESEEFGEGRELHDGGNFMDFENYLTENYGPVLESEVPYYEKYSIDDYEYLSNLKPQVYVGETINFPNINKQNESEEGKKEVELFRKKVKEHIIKNGSLYCLICASETSTDGKENGNTTMVKYGENWVLNYQGDCLTNHAVSIIGWDDNFPVENFPEECRPKEKGAYIVMNSWGEEWGNNGIFYVSYEDKHIEENINGIVKASTNIDDVLEKLQFEDINFYNAIKEMLGRRVIKYDDDLKEIYTTLNTLKDIQRLDLSNKNIADISGIEKFLKLHDINLSNNNIENIEPLGLLRDMTEMDLSNNMITDISPLEKNFINLLNISNNPIENGLDCMWVGSLKIDKCKLSEIQVNQISKITGLGELSIQYTNIQDVSILKKASVLRTLDASGNKNISGLEQLNNYLDSLTLRDCSLDNDIISKIKILENLNSIDLSNNNITELTGLENTKISNISLEGNPITDITPLGNNENIKEINLSNTGISDVSSLNKIETINLSNNSNLTNLDKLEAAYSLKLDNCNINDISFINSLNNLSEISFVDNKMQAVPNFSSSNCSSIDLSNNEISDISNIENLLPQNQDEIFICLANNNINNVPIITREGVNIDVSHNRIKSISENGYSNYAEQEINETYDLEINKENRIPLYEIFITAYNNRYKEKFKIIENGCTIDYETKEIIIKPECLGEGSASIIIKSDSSNWDVYGNNYWTLIKNARSNCKGNGTVLNINYNTKENIPLVGIDVDDRYKKIYLTGEDFDTSKLTIREIYENGLKYVVNDYQLENAQNLQTESNIIAKYQGFETPIPVKVYDKDLYCKVLLSEQLCDRIIELGINRNDIVDSEEDMDNTIEKNTISSDNGIKKYIITKEAVENFTKFSMNAFNLWYGNDYYGFGNLYNIQEITILNVDEENEALFKELMKLKKVKSINFTGYRCWEDNKINEYIKELLQKEDLEHIEFGTIKVDANDDIADKILKLPCYLKENDLSNITSNYKYKNSSNKEITVEWPIHVDDNGNLYVVFDTEVNDEKIYDTRRITFEINTDKIHQTVRYNYKWNPETEKPTVEITAEPLNEENTTDSNTVTYTFKWNEKVYGFTKDSISIENGEKGEFTEVKPNLVYKLVVANNVEEGQEGTQKITVNENECEDIVGNRNEKAEKEIKIDRANTHLDIQKMPNKTYYIAGQDFEANGMELIVVDKNGETNTITDYEIENGTDLQEGQEAVKIIYENMEVYVPIVVYSKEHYDIIFSEGVYSAISELLSEDIVYSEDYEGKIRCIVKKEGVDNLTHLDISNINFGYGNKADYTGLSKLHNLKKLEANKKGIYNQKGFFEEVCKLEQLEQLNLNGCWFDSSNSADAKYIAEVLELPNLQNIDFGETNITSGGEIEDVNFYLPEYLTEDDKENIEIKYTYKNENNEEKILEDKQILSDQNDNLYIVLNTKYPYEKKEDNIYRGLVTINILKAKGKINQKIIYYYYWKNEVLNGDLNGSGDIEPNDYIAILRHIAAQTDSTKEEWILSEEKQQLADVTKDGIININDVIKLKRYIAAKNDENVANAHPDWLEL